MEKRNCFSVRSGKRMILSLFVFALVLSASAASAHKFVLTPDSFGVPQGGAAGVSATFTEIIGTPEYSLSATGAIYNPMEVSFEMVYSDGTSSPIPVADFKPYDSKEMTQAAPDKSDIEYAKFKVAKPGTAVVHGKFKGTVDLSLFGGTGQSISISHVKTFLNLTSDGMATRRIGGSEVLEVVFADEVPEEGIKVGDTVRFKFYLNGELLKNAPVFASYIGAPTKRVMEGSAEVEVNDYIEKNTDSNGIADFNFDEAQGWFIGAFNSEGEEQEYGGGIMFSVFGSNGIEGDIAKVIIAAGGNQASIALPIWTGGPQIDFIDEEWGLVPANNLIMTPSGTTAFLSGLEDQLPGVDTGTKISIPLDITLSGKRGVIGFGQTLLLTSAALGDETLGAMADFLKGQHEAFERGEALSNAVFGEEGGYVYYIPYTPKILFERFGIAIMTRFSDGEVRDMTDEFQIGVVYDESTMGSAIAVYYGGIMADSAPDGGNYSIDVTDDMFPDGSPGKFAFMHDGKADGKIDFSYWLAEKELPMELPITDELVTGDKNKADAEFTVMPPYDGFIQSMGLTWMTKLVSSPRGETAFVTNQDADQLPGNSGVSVNIPFDVKESALKGLIGVGNPITLTPAMLGEDVFKSFTDFLKSEHASGSERFQSEDGIEFYMPFTPKDLLDRFGIEIICRFGDGKTLEATDNFVFGVVYDESLFESGVVIAMVGGMFVDSPPVDGEYWIDLTEQLPAEIGYKIALIYDGAADDALRYSYWLAKKTEDSGGGGCSAGALGIFALGLAALATYRKRG